LKPVRKVVFNIADSHGGFVAGLCNPDVTLYNEDKSGSLSPFKPQLTDTQKYLWEQYINGIEETKAIAGKDEIIVIHNGDLTHGNKHLDTLVSSRPSDQFLIGQANLDPLYKIKNVKAIRVIIGTGAHNFSLGTSELVVANALQGMYPKIDTKAMYHSHITINGCVLDTAHHGPYPGSREWLRGNVARYYLTDLLMREAINGEKPPDMVMRAHYHRYIIERYKFNGNWHSLVILPPLSFLNDFAHKAAQSPDRATSGVFAFEVIDGRVGELYEHMMKTVDIRTKEAL
jgi:hypothetical protein